MKITLMGIYSDKGLSECRCTVNGKRDWKKLEKINLLFYGGSM